MIQSALVVLFFAGAAAYLGWLVYRSFQAKSCATGCGKCSAVDFNQVEKAIRAKEKAFLS
jgi:hypothetical protein